MVSTYIAAIFVTAILIVGALLIFWLIFHSNNTNKECKPKTNTTAEDRAIRQPAFENHLKDISNRNTIEDFSEDNTKRDEEPSIPPSQNSPLVFTSDEVPDQLQQVKEQQSSIHTPKESISPNIYCKKCGNNNIVKEDSSNRPLTLPDYLILGVTITGGIGALIGTALKNAREKSMNKNCIYHCENCGHRWKENM